MPDGASARPDSRSGLEQVADARTGAVERGEGGDGTSPRDPAGAEDGAGGTAGQVRNPDVAAQ